VLPFIKKTIALNLGVWLQEKTMAEPSMTRALIEMNQRSDGSVGNEYLIRASMGMAYGGKPLSLSPLRT